MKKLLLLSCLAILTQSAYPQAYSVIEPTFNSSNAWMTDYVGDVDPPLSSPGPTQYGSDYTTNPNGKLYPIGNYTGFINDVSSKILRFGGKLGDVNFYDTVQAQQFIDFCAARNIKPLFQIPFMYFYYNKAEPEDAITAANILQIKKMIIFLKSKGVKYYSIGNESDHYHKYPYYKNDSLQLNALQISKFFKPVAQAIKEVDGNAFIFGPDFAQHQPGLMNGLINLNTPSTDITAEITSIPGKYFCDAWSQHYYPFDSLQTYQQVLDKSTSYFKPVVLEEIRTKIASSSSNPNLKIAINEMNIAWQNKKYSNTRSGTGTNSFVAGQFLAETYSYAMDRKYGASLTGAPVMSVMPWSWHESGGSGSQYDLGLLRNNGSGTNYSAVKGRSTYWHIWLLQNFTTRFYRGTYSQNGATTPTYSNSIKTFANAEAGGFRIIILNQSPEQYDFRIRFKPTAPTTPSGTINFNYDFSSDTDLGLTIDTTYYPYTGVTALPLKGYSTVLLTFNCHGSLTSRIEYTLQDDLADSVPHLRQIGNINVDPAIGICGQGGGIGGTIVGNQTYANQTVYVNSDILLASNSKLTFDNATVIMAPGTTIKGTPMSSLEIKNSHVVGCEGKRWKGIEMLGNYNNGERLRIENSQILNADRPVRTDRIPDLKITKSVFANGETGIELNRSESFTISENVIGGFKTGISTSNTKQNFVSEIKENKFLEVLTGIKFDNDKHSMLSVICNDLKYRDKAIESRLTALKEQGDATLSAGNKFTRETGQPINYIDHTGGLTKYYYGPSEVTEFSYPGIMNIPKIQAVSDRVCLNVSAAACPLMVSVEEITKHSLQMLIYPNPNNGTFTVSLTDKIKGSATLTVIDVLGKVISKQKVNSGSQTVSLNTKTKGLYFVILENEEQRLTQKVIIE